MEVLARLIEPMPNDLAKLHQLETYASFGLESQAYVLMQETWKREKEAILKYLKENKSSAAQVLLKARAFKAMCSFKIAFIATELSEKAQAKTVVTIVSFIDFLRESNEQEGSTVALKSAISLVTSSLLTLSNYLKDEMGSETRLNLLSKCLEVAELGPSSTPSLDKVKILQAIGKL